MATDIAFALGVLLLMGRRAPLALKIFLTALAIVDDLGAVLVIALFYTAEISWGSLLLGFGVLGVLAGLNRAGVRRTWPYVVLGLIVWVAFLKSGVHATIAGVLLALTIPARHLIHEGHFYEKARFLIDEFGKRVDPGNTDPDESQRQVLHELDHSLRAVDTPLHRMEHALHPWTAFFILPVFALANAGVGLGSGLGEALASPVSLGVLLGLVVGKPLGVMFFAWLSVRLGMAALPTGITWRQMFGVSCLTGIGFTMSLFIANLAFTNALLIDQAKIGILAASICAGLLGWFLLSSASKAAPVVAEDEV